MTARPDISGVAGAVQRGPGIGSGDRDPRSLTVPAAPVSPSLRVFIPWLAPSLNTVWSSRHWSHRQEFAKDGHLMTLTKLRGAPKLRPPVMLIFQPIQPRGNFYDTDNYILTAKVVTDGLVRAGLLPGDSFRYVQAVVLLCAQRGPEAGVWLEAVEVEE